MSFTDFDKQMMMLAIQEATKSIYRVSPNPRVGAIICKNNEIISRGAHLKFGEAHAEVNAIQNAKTDLKGATIYITLEPCSHFGKTPPCTDAIKNSGISRVVFAMNDPNPKVKEKNSTKILQDSGIIVESGLLSEESVKINQPFIKNITKKLPYITLKWAMSLDGKIATVQGDSKWISNEKCRNIAHYIRSQHDGIAVGQNTFELDDPELTCRIDKNIVNPTRILFLNQIIPAYFTKKIFSNTLGKTIIMVKKLPEQALLSKLKDTNIDVVLQEKDLQENLKVLFEKGISSLLVEGGGNLLGRLFDTGLCDYCHCFLAPIIIGDKGFSPVAGVGFNKIADAKTLISFKSEQIDDNLHLQGFIQFYRQ